MSFGEPPPNEARCYVSGHMPPAVHEFPSTAGTEIVRHGVFVTAASVIDATHSIFPMKGVISRGIIGVSLMMVGLSVSGFFFTQKTRLKGGERLWGR